ncbi:MAG: PEP-CTERM sorting domain-containing protein [Burkholderiales bacterium]
MYKKFIMLALLAGWGISGATQASLIDNGGGLIYDSTLNITWLQDGSYAKTTNYVTPIGPPGPPGQLDWVEADYWAETLDYHGITGWRLPTFSTPVTDPAYYAAYNVTSPASELSYLFYVELGNVGLFDPSGQQRGGGYGLVNTGPFKNLVDSDYWYGTPFLGGSMFTAWEFNMAFGYQKGNDPNLPFNVLAVHPGDVSLTPTAPASTIPVPGTVWLLGIGLLAWLGVARHKRVGNSAVLRYGLPASVSPYPHPFEVIREADC